MLKIFAHAGHTHSPASEASIPLPLFLVGGIIVLVAIIGIAYFVSKNHHLKNML